MQSQDSILSDIEKEETESSYWQRVLSNMIDWLIEVGLFVGIYFIIPIESIAGLLNEKTYLSYIAIFILIFSYRLVCLLLFGKTIGMMICNIKYLNAGLQPLSPTQKMIAAFATRTGSIRLYKN